MSNNDIEQKLTLARLFWAWGYMPHLEIKVGYPEASSIQRYELTDIDVYGVRVTLDFTMERLIGDCKTLRNVSPINRAFWLKGIMEYLGVDRGYLVLRSRRPITEDHKVSAKTMGITLMSENDLWAFQSKLLPANFPRTMKLFQQESWTYFEGNIASAGFLKQLDGYRKYQYWLDPASRALRHSLLETRSVRQSIDPKQKFHQALVLDMATLFSVAFLDMVCYLFHVYLIPRRKEDMDTYLKAYVYGGREYYSYANQLMRSLQELRRASAQGDEGQDTTRDLSLPEWNRFLQLFRTVLDNPSPFRDVCRIMRFVLFERLLYNNHEIQIAEALPEATDHTVKLALDVIEYFLRASGLYDKLWGPLSQLMVDSLGEFQGIEGDDGVRLAHSAAKSKVDPFVKTTKWPK